jgi:hypothetical protein
MVCDASQSQRNGDSGDAASRGRGWVGDTFFTSTQAHAREGGKESERATHNKRGGGLAWVETTKKFRGFGASAGLCCFGVVACFCVCSQFSAQPVDTWRPWSHTASGGAEKHEPCGNWRRVGAALRVTSPVQLYGHRCVLSVRPDGSIPPSSKPFGSLRKVRLVCKASPVQQLNPCRN